MVAIEVEIEGNLGVVVHVLSLCVLGLGAVQCIKTAKLLASPKVT